MIGLEFTCDTCGTRFEVPNYFGGTGSAFMSGNQIGCPAPGCSGMGHHKEGTYDFVDGVISSFTAPGMTREKVQKVKEIAEAVEAGEKDTHTAYLEVVEIDDRLAETWNWMNENAGAIGVLLAILSILLAHYYWKQSGASAEEDRRVVERQSKALEKIGEELEKQRLDGALPAGQAPPKQEMLTLPLKQIAASPTPNRHERRKAAAIERRKSSGAK